MTTANLVGARFLICVCVVLAVGCSTTVNCPQKLERSLSVFLINHGRHTTIALADEKGHLWRYGYGDWRYYAETNTGYLSAARALLWPTPAALGRQQYDVDAPTSQQVNLAVRVPVHEVYQFRLPVEKVNALRNRLDSVYWQGAEERLLINPRSDFTFVPHPQDYWLWHNSNHKVVEWLETLGCKSEGVPTFTLGISGAG